MYIESKGLPAVLVFAFYTATTATRLAIFYCALWVLAFFAKSSPRRLTSVRPYTVFECSSRQLVKTTIAFV